MYVCMYVNIYIYTYVCICICMCIYIYIILLRLLKLLADIAILSSPCNSRTAPSPSDKTTAAWVHLVLARPEARLRVPGDPVMFVGFM